jgi:hypothetical protein
MKVQINTDKNVEGSGRLETYFSDEIEKIYLDLMIKLHISKCILETKTMLNLV